MELKFYYIRGISREDTPFFSSRGKQKDYFNSHIIKSIDYSFFPPYMFNDIKLSSDDINFESNINYLSFEYGSREYYYFITELHYVNENTISLSIEMDTIQTFMFDTTNASGIGFGFTLTSAVIERKFINRWKKDNEGNWIINRDYLRENVSRGNFIYDTDDYLTSDEDYWYYMQYTNSPIIDSAQIGKELATSDYASMTYDANTKPIVDQIFSSYAIYAIPANMNGDIDWIIQDKDTIGNGSLKNKLSTATTLAHVTKSPYLANLYALPYNPYLNIKIDRDKGTIKGDIALAAYCLNDVSTTAIIAGGSYILALGTSNYLAPKKFTIALDYERNENEAYLFDKKYVPALVDDNYMRLMFGEKSFMAQFPLYNSTKVEFNGYYLGNPLNGSRTYWISPNGYSEYQDYYFTKVTTAALISFDLKTDKYLEYMAYNRANMAVAQLEAANNAMDSAINSTQATRSSTLKQYSGKEVVEKSSRQVKGRAGRTRTLKSSSSKVMKPYAELSMTQGDSSLSASTSMFNPIINEVGREVNAMYAPDGAKQHGNVGINICAQDNYLKWQRMHVDDIEQCARYYQRYGYLVNEYINYNTNIFAKVNTRKYFNYLKLSRGIIHILSYIQNDEVEDDIKDRLFDGIRLWNVSENIYIGNYNFDNIEQDFLN